ncbi:MAG: hypothetical protein M1485_00890, partial [Chloroflexi bacterium]|nr:hypothetical protein [Chloroflexota bacterium]
MKSTDKKHRSNWLPFEEARRFARQIGLKNYAEWRAWAKTEDRPENIPVGAYAVYKNNGWVSWGDWLGTGNKKGGYLPFVDARDYACRLNLTKQSEWAAWAKTTARPRNIPADPRNVYKEEWVSMGDWLGTGNVWSANRVYLPFEKARKFARSLKLKSLTEWSRWAKLKEKPDNIPAYPNSVYRDKGWESWGDWLGTGTLAPSKQVWRNFEEARLYARNLGFQNVAEWLDWARTDKRPNDIPAYPSDIYKNKGWVSWTDWLKTKNKKGGWRTYDEAHKYALGLNLGGQTEWASWVKTSAKPEDIPSDPRSAYGKSRWRGWGDWLGNFSQWNKYTILNFLNGIKSILPVLQPAELYAIMKQNGMVIASKNSANTNASLIKSIRDLCSSPNPESDFEKLIAEIERENQLLDEDIEEEPIAEVDVVETAGAEDLPALRSMQALKAVDELVQAGITSDEETIEFLVANRVSGLWQDTLNNGGTIGLDTLRNEKGGVYFETIRSRFLSQYDGAQSLAIPRGYDFRVNGKIAQPNLMQKLAAYRVLSEKRLGNWSGVGAGKTLSAILASRVIDARLTVIVAFNSTIMPWAERVREAFPNSKILIKERGNISIDPAKHTYLILNFETFQQPDSVAMVEHLVEKHKIDFVVLDEIQSVKQRTPKVASLRRQRVSYLLAKASEKNPNLRVLGMSATPVINNLYEAKALLELVKGVSFDELETFSNIPNAIAMHEKLILYGIRYRPEYKQTIQTEFKEIQGNDFLPQLVKLRKGAILDLERVLLDAKMKTILASLKKGTLIYTHYLTGLVIPLRHAIEKAGYKVGLFTGGSGY